MKMSREGHLAPPEITHEGHDQVTNTNDSFPNVPSSSTTTDLNRIGAVISDARRSSSSNHHSAIENPLPLGWEMAVAPNGKNYYIDHNSRTTTWTRPEPDDNPQEWILNEDLPAGWEIRYAPEYNRKYYVDHNTRSTSWNPPRKDREEITTNSAAERESNALASDRKGENGTHTVTLEDGDKWKLVSKL